VPTRIAIKQLRVPAALFVSVLAGAACRSGGCLSEESCVEGCYPIVFRDAAVADSVPLDVIVCPALPDPDTGECPRGCEESICFT
jgi:hypothetical protein